MLSKTGELQSYTAKQDRGVVTEGFSAVTESRLFMFYIGGDCGNSNIELHDVRFSVGASAKDCYDDLRAQWWGTPKSLHIDSWTEISQVDGYDVTLSKQPFKGPERIYFLNLGGYTNNDFEEVHKNLLVVAISQRVAIQRSILAQTEWKLPHKDAIMELEKAIRISDQIKEHGLFLHLVPATEIKTLQFTAKYTRLAR